MDWRAADLVGLREERVSTPMTQTETITKIEHVRFAKKKISDGYSENDVCVCVDWYEIGRGRGAACGVRRGIGER